MPSTFHESVELNIAVYQIECFGKIDKTYKIWSNALLAFNQAMKDEYIIWGSTSSKETSIMLILFVESLVGKTEPVVNYDLEYFFDDR